MKKILLPTDFSKASERAIEYALNLFNEEPCEFTLMHAYDTYPSGGSPEIAYALIEEMFNRAKKEIVTQLDKVERLDTKKIHRFKTDLMPTSPGSAIQILNQKHQYDFVLVGATGKGDDILFGSTATDVVRNVTTNALIVPQKVKITPVRNIVLAVDYQPINSFKEFDSLKELLLQKNATLTLLTVLKEDQLPTELDSLLKFEYHDYFKGISILDYQVHAQNVQEGIIDYLSTHEADMLAMVTRRHSFFDVLFNRSVTRKFAYNPTIPLLSIYDEANVEVPEHEIVTF
jgi:nucleotide-binding universal stress UspA family protein